MKRKNRHFAFYTTSMVECKKNMGDTAEQVNLHKNPRFWTSLKRRASFVLFILFSSITVFAQTDQAISISGPSSVSAGMTYTVSVQYSASQQRDVAVYLFNTTVWNTWGSARTTVPAGTGTVNLTVTVTNPAVGSDYQWTGKVETVGGSQALGEVTQWCQVVTAPGTAITVSANFASATGKSVKKRAFGLNLFRGFDPNTAGTPGNSTYKTNMAAMRPAHVRYHSWEMISTGVNSWVKANGDWDATRINNAMSGANSWNPEILINIPWFPSSKNWGDANGKLKTANYTDFANWCAQLVQIVNIQQGRNVKYWEVTNERDDLYYGSCTELGQIFNQAAAAMKAIDPTIKVGGPSFAQPFAEHVQNINDFMSVTKNTVDFISYHNYPTNQNLTNQQVFDNTWGWINNFMRERWAAHSTRVIEFHHNEYNISYNPPMTAMNNEAGMVFDALMIASMLENGVDVANAWNEADGWYGKLDGSFNRRPASYLYENFNKNYNEAPIYSSTTSDGTKIYELASKTGNQVQVLVINRAESDQLVKFAFSGLGTLDASTPVVITESIRSGGLVTKNTTIGAITTGVGFLSEAFAVSLFTFQVGPVANGQVIREYWTGISGTAVSAIPVTTTPTGTSVLTSLECPVNWADNYGTRIRGYIVPTTTGSYTFYVASDDQSELWLSTNDQPTSKAKIASVTGWTNNKEWTKYASQKSSAITLTAGQKYYFEALQKEGGGGDNFAIGWTGPGISTITVIGSANISSYTATAPIAVTSVSVSPTSKTLTVGATQQLTATVLPSGATNKNVSWSSSNTSVATVNTSGLVTGIAAGSATITVKTQDGNKTATSAITVNVPASAVYNIYTESGINHFANDGGFNANYAMTIVNQTSGAPEGSQYRSITPSNHYASYRFEFAASGKDKSSWSNALLEFSARSTTGYDIYLEDAAGNNKYLPLHNYMSYSGAWENVSIPINAFTGVNLSTLRRIGFYRTWQTTTAFLFDNIRVTGSGVKSLALEESLTDLANSTTGFTIYPNPVAAGESIRIKDLKIDPSKELLVVITDLTGRVAYIQAILTFEEKNLEISTTNSNMGSGIYIVRVINGSEQLLEKLIVR